MCKIKIILPAIFGVFLCSTAASDTWHNANHQWRKSITGIYARGGSTLTDFPILISITDDSDLSNYAKANGYDICFYASNNGALLKHEIEYYSNGTLIAWVKMPSLTGILGENELYMYYGYPASAAMQDPVNVWDANYRAVWHKNDLTSSTIKDSSANAQNGNKKGANEPSETTGKISKGQLYDGADDFINAGAPLLSNAMTISLWCKALTINERNIMMQQYVVATAGRFLFWWETDNKVDMNISGGSAKTSSALTADTWYHIVLTRDNANLCNGYIIGMTNIAPWTAADMILQTDNTKIGGNYSTYFFHGIIDEVRISTNTRSAGWILTEYSNQFAPENFNNVGTAFDGLDVSFSVYPNNKPISIPLVYSNQSAGIYPITNAIFQFGDGTAVTNTDTNALNTVQKTYTVPGIYTNWLTVATTKPETKSNSNVLNVGEYIFPKLNLYWVPEQPIIGKYVVFVANSTTTYGAITNWRIDFGTGSKYIWRQYMTNHPVAYRYPYSGEHVVRFSVVDQYGYSNVLTLTNNVTDFGARDVKEMPKRVFKYGRDFPLYFKYRLTGEARKVQLRVIHMNGMILRNLGFKEGFEGEDILFTWDGKTQWNTYLTYPPCFLRYDVYSEDGFIETVIEVIVVY